ncbi:acyl-CoA dehydrogenase family protein [Erythrobacter sp. SD-21]|uniref:acyl-CoA dehydrogenase family protein n=1 Tax=Erythrobacter sp. SD-21 TaxID=161528 RepID=UPI000153F6E8|nr:acyl-CoA dehydrogenase family protein [Erythrobacter sp. SD-21]EDL48060.1 Acyl-CoA dehydrogenase [Erythrobacter sp. SD-21]
MTDLLETSNFGELLIPIAERASRVDSPEGDLAPDIETLRKEGWLSACLPTADGGRGWGTEPSGSLAALDALRFLGRANLSVVRLFEGHMNAVKLIALYGDERQRAATFGEIRRGALFGVWGADDPGNPLTMVCVGEEIRLSGAKRFASGLGLVDRAIVIVSDGDGGPYMLLAPTSSTKRSDATGWTMAGMRATRSGRYDFRGLVLSADSHIGQKGDYLREPHFEGGIWRYCAAHLGGAEALYLKLLAHLTARGRTDDLDQRRRVVACATALETCRLWLVRCAREIEGSDAGPDKATLALLAREVTEATCRETMETVDRSVGMAAHQEGEPFERMKRDLSLFLCQAAPDAKREKAGRALFLSGKLVEMI